jgi:hypothetical protein
MAFPAQFQKVLKTELFLDVIDELYEGWRMTNESYRGSPSLFWTQGEKNVPTYMMAGSIIRLKVMRELKQDVRLARVQANGQTSGQISDFHKDFSCDGVWTFILFTPPQWDLDWGGEFICKDPDTEQFHYTPCVPNFGVLIPSNWWHKGCSPNAKTSLLRTSLAFSYATPETFDRLCQERDDVKPFR